MLQKKIWIYLSKELWNIKIWNKSLFNQYDSYRGRHLNASSRVLYRKTKDPFWAKICMKTSFQLLLYIMKVKSQEDQQVWSSKFSDVMWESPKHGKLSIYETNAVPQ